MEAGAPSLACSTLPAVMGRSLSTTSMPGLDTDCFLMLDFSTATLCCMGCDRLSDLALGGHWLCCRCNDCMATARLRLFTWASCMADLYLYTCMAVADIARQHTCST